MPTGQPQWVRRAVTLPGFSFYALDHPVQVRVDNDEILDHCWLSPQQALQRCDEGGLRLPLPTRETLGALAMHNSLMQMCAAVAAADIHIFPADSPYYVPRCAD